MEALEKERPHILVSDIAMPEEDGLSLMRRIRALPRERGGRIPAVALTAHSMVQDRLQSLRAGFQSHVPKPVVPEELVEVVTSIVHLRSSLGGLGSAPSGILRARLRVPARRRTSQRVSRLQCSPPSPLLAASARAISPQHRPRGSRR